MSAIGRLDSRGVGRQKLAAEGREALREDGFAGPPQQVLIEVDVVNRGEDRGEDLVGREEMVQVGAREAAGAGQAVAGRVDGVGVAPVAPVAEADAPPRREDRGAARKAQRNPRAEIGKSESGNAA